ncbi:HAMP domain-containing protein [Aquabacterium lacunae]|uniref:HAMP domain-containing protein n=1 Tax=Aquabacterium lacunae TaxID=2528630 RepID=A0A4Q9H2D7_9BURK|nr:methyl-accepting chemotaxis protein [Aquabacterium lacunae]TBO27961.1 HAMP domain-containing protein [Aquabacterium lacunae]
MFLNRMKLGPRLTVGFGIVLALVLGIASVGWVKLNAITRGIEATRLADERARMADEWAGLTALNVNRTLAVAKSGSHEEVKAHFTPLMKATSARISELQKTLEGAAAGTPDEAVFADIAAKRKTYIESRDHIFQLLDIDDPGAKEALDSRLMPQAEAYLNTIRGFRESQEKLAIAVGAGAEADARRAQVAIAGLSVLCISAGLGFAWLVTRSVTRPLQKVVDVTHSIATGDLSKATRGIGDDEISNVLNRLEEMRTSLGRIVLEVRESTESIRVASTEVASGSLDLSGRTEQTASSLQQTASSMEEISTTVAHTAEAAGEARRMSVEAAAAAAKGGEVVAQVVSTMGEINERSRRIVDIISVIDGIAFQTNILALNAAVEAARAGEQGRGFAVVAGEVRSLAQRSAQAAKEIKGLITASAESVEAGTRLVEEAGTSMQHIVSSVQQVSSIVSDITHAANEQSNGIGLVNGAVSQLDQMTQQNAALVEQSAAAAESLKDQSHRLSDVVSVFRLAGDRHHSDRHL